MVEFVVAIDEARVRFTDDAELIIFATPFAELIELFDDEASEYRFFLDHLKMLQGLNVQPGKVIEWIFYRPAPKERDIHVGDKTTIFTQINISELMI